VTCESNTNTTLEIRVKVGLNRVWVVYDTFSNCVMSGQPIGFAGCTTLKIRVKVGLNRVWVVYDTFSNVSHRVNPLGARVDTFTFFFLFLFFSFFFSLNV
jgi:hypothetical protein